MNDRVQVSTGHAIDVGHRVAGLGARSYAFVIDWHIRLLLALAWLLLYVVAGFILGDPPDFGNATLWIVFTPAAVMYLAYHPVLEITGNGATPGKRIAGVRIARNDGGDASPGQHLVRNLFRIVDSLPALYCIGILSALFSRQQLRIGDFAAGTVMVYGRSDNAGLDAMVSRYARGGARDPALTDLAFELLERWDALEPDRRTAMARRLLEHFGITSSNDEPATSLRARLQSAIEHESG